MRKERQKMRQFKNKDFRQAIKLLNERERDEAEIQNKHLIQLYGSMDSSTDRTKRSVDSMLTSSSAQLHNRKKKKLTKEERRLRREERKRKRRERRKNKGNKDKRALNYYRYGRRRRGCARQQMYVDFDEIGWSGWIISPKGYNAYHCKGGCPFPLGQSQKPTNHATVQSIVHALKVGKDVSTPCCVPNKLYSISLLYFDDEENVILKQYDDMVAASCGCH